MRYHFSAMRFRWLILGAAIVALALTPVRLYLKDGTFQMVNEYKVLEDRVRYYSTERSDWEEIPLDLVDLKRTMSELKAKAQEEKKEAAETAAEDTFEREQKREIAMLPDDGGLYMIDKGQLRTFKLAEVKIANNKRRSVLKVLSPIPLVYGKSTVELDGEHAAQAVDGDRPTFYFRPLADERYGMVRCSTRKKGVRIVETWNIIPVTKEIAEEREEVELFQQQVGPNLFRIWPVKPVDPGEYAVIEYTEGKGNTQTWDFRVKEGPAPSNPAQKFE